jgi:hypothetical protein
MLLLRSACTEQVTHPQPCTPASPSRVVGWSSRQAGSQQLHTPPPCTPSRAAPTWADIARGGNNNPTHQEAPSASPADAITLYKQYVSMGLQARFSLKYNAGYEEIHLFCRFPKPSVARHQHPARHRQRRRNHHCNRGKPATCSTSAQTEPLICTPPARLQRHASPSHLDRAASSTAPPPAKFPCPSVPPPAKKTRKRRCELELLRANEVDSNLPLTITPPTLQLIPRMRLLLPSSPAPLSPTPLLPKTPRPLPVEPPFEPLASTPPNAVPSPPRPTPASPETSSPESTAPDPPALILQPPPPSATPLELHQREPAVTNIPVAPPFQFTSLHHLTM